MKHCLENILICLFLVYTPVISGQNVHFNNIIVENGLFTNEIYDIFQDRRGRMWFATNLGVCMYNGYDFTNYTTRNGLADNVVFQIKEFDNTMYFNTFHGGIFSIDNDTILPYRFNTELLEKVGLEFTFDFIVDNDTLWFNISNNNGLFLIDGSGVVEEYLFNNKESTFYVKDISESKICGFLNQFLEADVASVITEQETFITVPTIAFNRSLRPRCDSKYFFYGHHLITDIYSTKTSAILFDRDIASLYTDNQNGLWVGTHGGGVLFYKNSNLEDHPKEYLSGKTISDIYEDVQGNIWFSTIERGLFCLKPNKSSHFPLDERIMVIKCSNSAIFCGTDNGNVYKIHGSAKELIYNNPLGYAIKDILILDSTQILVNSIVVNHIANTQHYFNPITSDRNNIYTHHGEYFVSAYNGINLIKNKRLVYDSQLNGFKDRVKRVFSFSSDSLFILSRTGLFLFADKTITNIVIDGVDELEITALNKWQGQLLISTKTNGVFLLDDSLRIKQKFNKETGLSSYNCWDIHVFKEMILVGSNKGVDVIKMSKKGIDITNINSSNLLHYNKVNCISTLNDNIIIGTDYGVEIFNNSAKNYNFNECYISDFKVHNLRRDLNDLTLTHNQNNIEISYVSPNYENDVSYKYRLVGATSDWSETDNNFIKFSQLSSGEYTFEVQPFVNDQYGNITTINFIINPHFMKTWWFILSALLLLSGITYKIVIDLKLKEGYKRKAIQSTQKALRAQMNPHFLFNALNSIQSYILINETELSVKYLNKFASLVRQVLDNSMHDFVTIKDDLSALENYIQLEEIRFEDKFEYVITIDEELDIHTCLIPPLLLQPIIENAIWHGLLHKENGGGKISISLKIEEDAIICDISDNGVGKVISQNIEGAKSYKSVGLKITKERVTTLNSNSQDKFQIKISDLYKNHKETGTLVKLTIPILKKKMI
jgi:two-component sensor histidine kinase